LEHDVDEIKKYLACLTVLYAEDNEKIRENTVRTLEILFNKVLVAKDGTEAISLFQNNTVDLLITDYVMPDFNGYEVAKFIREESDLPIIISSSFSDKEKLMNAIELGVICYLEKPVRYEQLIDGLKKVVAQLNKQNKIKVEVAKDLYYDRLSHSIISGDNVTQLSKVEKEFVEILIENRGRVVSKEVICDLVFEQETSDHAIRNVIYRLRKKVGNGFIKTFKELGYMIG
jgi:DNA-binding response OmpR family regulator